MWRAAAGAFTPIPKVVSTRLLALLTGQLVMAGAICTVRAHDAGGTVLARSSPRVRQNGRLEGFHQVLLHYQLNK